jgi:hypothetical protein
VALLPRLARQVPPGAAPLVARAAIVPLDGDHAVAR